jgi:hypothetical protein
MELKHLFKNSSTKVLDQNKELLEEHDLLNVLGSPNKLFLKFLNSKNMKINEDEITEELIEEFEDSMDSINLKLAKIQKEKETIFNQRKVWINIPSDDGWIGTDMFLDYDGIIIDETKKKIFYSKMKDIEIADGGWSKKRIIINTDNGDFVFEINENKAVPLKEIIEDNVENQNYSELDALLELFNQFEEGKISHEEFEARKAVIYSDDVYCTNCGYKLDADSRFCPECGHEVMD